MNTFAVFLDIFKTSISISSIVYLDTIFWVDTLGSLEPTGINKKGMETVFESADINNTVTLVILFSKTCSPASKTRIWQVQ